MNDDIINRYTLMLIKQYWEKPKAKSEIQAMLRHWQIIADFIRNPDNFDLDQVTGYRLDVIGRIIGLARSVPEVIAKIFFGFDGHINSAGFSSKSDVSFIGAPFFRKFAPAYGDYQLGDNEYRRFLKVKIAKNAASSTISSDDRVSLQEVIQAAFNGEAYVTDRKDMTLALNISPKVPRKNCDSLFNSVCSPGQRGSLRLFLPGNTRVDVWFFQEPRRQRFRQQI